MRARRVSAVIFDMDGTLTRPILELADIAVEIGVPAPFPECINALPAGPERDRAISILDAHERMAADRSELNDDVVEVLEFLAERRISAGLLTRNSRAAARRILEKHGLEFPAIVTREDAPPKPDPRALWTVCDRLRVSPDHSLLVGDFVLDVMSGRNAGIRTVLLTNGWPPGNLTGLGANHVISRLGELRRLLSPV